MLILPCVEYMKIGARSYSSVKIEALDSILVPISTGKPAVPEVIQEKWQNMVDLVARIGNVTAGLVTRFTEEALEIVASSSSAGNPFTKNQVAPLGKGMFCETTAGKGRELRVEDINTSIYWKTNPLAFTGMQSYYGVPLFWEDGELFGTLCVLDCKPNSFEGVFNELLEHFKSIIECDLKYIGVNAELNKRLSVQEILIREAHHRINNHFTLLISYIQLKASEVDKNCNVNDLLLDVQNRIRSISLIHDELCCATPGKDLPPLDEYLSKLCNCLVSNLAGIYIDIRCEVDKLELPVELTVSIGLVVAELITNSVKYAFAKEGAPAIRLSVHRTAERRITVKYEDNGVGLPPGFDVKSTTTIGMTLIRLQVEQLHGEMQVSGEGGAKFSIVIDG